MTEHNQRYCINAWITYVHMFNRHKKAILLISAILGAYACEHKTDVFQLVATSERLKGTHNLCSPEILRCGNLIDYLLRIQQVANQDTHMLSTYYAPPSGNNRKRIPLWNTSAVILGIPYKGSIPCVSFLTLI